MTLRREQTVVRLTFGDGWIDVRSERKYKDTVNAQRAAATRVQATAKAGRGEKSTEAAAQFDFDVTAFNLALLTNMIVAWSDKDVPINEETVQELPDAIAQEVLDVILEGRSEAEIAPLETTSTSPSEPPEGSS